MSVFDHSRAITNQTMCNEFKFDALGNHKLSMNAAKVPLSQQNTIDRRSSSTIKSVFKDIQKIQSKLEMRSNVSPDRNYSDATTATASHDERRVSNYLRALEEVAKSNSEIGSVFLYIRENLENFFHSLLTIKRDENSHVSNQIEQTKKQITEEKKHKQKAQEMNENL